MLQVVLQDLFVKDIVCFFWTNLFKFEPIPILSSIIIYFKNKVYQIHWEHRHLLTDHCVAKELFNLVKFNFKLQTPCSSITEVVFLNFINVFLRYRYSILNRSLCNKSFIYLMNNLKIQNI